MLAQAAVCVGGLADIDGVTSRVTGIIEEIYSGESSQGGSVAVKVAACNTAHGECVG